MPIVHDFDIKKSGSLMVDSADQLPFINKKRYGNGLADIIPSISNLISNNKELISNVYNAAKAIGRLGEASSKVTQAVKAAKELSQLKAKRENNSAKKNKVIVRKKTKVLYLIY